MIMKLVPAVFLLGALFSHAAAYSLMGGTVALNKEVLFSVDPAFTDAYRVTLNAPKDIVSLSLNIGSSSQPHQLMFLLSDNKGLDHAVFAKYTNRKAKADISVNKLPSALKATERIFVSILAAHPDQDEININVSFAEFLPSEALRNSTDHQRPQRLGALPEVHHIFKADGEAVNSIVPVVFSGLAIVLFVVLIGTWVSELGAGLFASRSGSVFKLSLLATISYFEFTFFKYYLGASIFSTLFHTVLGAGPFVFFASRALTSLARLRADGKA